MAYERQEIIKKLKDRDYKVTPQRKTILNVFFANNDHLSAENVYQIVKQEYPEIGLATVYRTLELFAELGILEKMNFDDGKARYELSTKSKHHHHHLICLRCGKVIEFTDDLLDVLEKTVAEKKDFEIVDHKLKFYGYCSECKK